ncbi:MAG: universal stress protein [Candidatus Omnitrophica bacterium]|nr:universal stress protein [Candidatus Omnitrophota bacterium]
MAMILKKVERPRELKWYQASSMLYGDWGTSKAYVLGIAFALAGHGSWALLGLMSLLTALVGFCYTIICRIYPDGGGVYSSVKSRSPLLAVVGALLLMANYVVTVSLSTLDAFHYLDVPNPQIWAIVTIVFIGAINWLGPTKSSNLSMPITLLASGSAIVLFLFTLPHLTHIELEWPTGGWYLNWKNFVGIVLALSGVEVIANMTGIMELPVEKTSKRAIWPVLLEVSILTFLLGVAMNAIPGLTGHTEDMLRALGSYYIGPWYGVLISVFFGFLLISAGNTAIQGLVSIQFLMAKDRELPPVFARLNRFGMPGLALVVATWVPVVVLIVDHDIVGLAALYAIGVVGAIALNLGTCATNFNIPLKRWERAVLIAGTVIMFFIELTIAVEKRNALFYAASILMVGLILRSIAKMVAPVPVPSLVPTAHVLTVSEAKNIAPLCQSSSLVALKGLNLNLISDAAMRAKVRGENSVYLGYVEEVPPGAELPEEFQPSEESLKIFAKAEEVLEKEGITVIPVWQVGDNPGKTIAYAARELGVNTVLIGTTRRSALINLLRGDVLRTLTTHLPKECRLIISS